MGRNMEFLFFFLGELKSWGHLHPLRALQSPISFTKDYQRGGFYLSETVEKPKIGPLIGELCGETWNFLLSY